MFQRQDMSEFIVKTEFDRLFANVNHSECGVIDIPKGVMLYRANDVLEAKPRANICHDTGKTGTYFSANSPYLAETMCSEYGKNMIIGIYRVIKPIHVIVGKYTIKYEDVSHVDGDIEAIKATRIDTKPFAEVFITAKQIDKIELIDSYMLMFQESVDKWGLMEWA